MNKLNLPLFISRLFQTAYIIRPRAGHFKTLYLDRYPAEIDMVEKYNQLLYSCNSKAYMSVLHSTGTCSTCKDTILKIAIFIYYQLADKQTNKQTNK